jgi:hypothetical protein
MSYRKVAPLTVKNTSFNEFNEKQQKYKEEYPVLAD